MDAAFVAVFYTALHAAAPLLLAGTGELITEKSGVLNLGVEGMMLVGAVVGFIAGFHGGGLWLPVCAAAVAGAAMAFLFALLTVGLRVNQVATGLALTIFGAGLSAFLGQSYTGKPLPPPPHALPENWADIPFLGKLLFAHDSLTYFAFLIPLAVWFLFRTRWGLILRAVGENHGAAHALGFRVTAIRFAAVVSGGALCGIGGAYLSLVYTPLWAENMTAGRGWIALALVVFAAWRPLRLLAGAVLFGFVGVGELFMQGWNYAPPSQFLSMAPYLATLIALAVLSARRGAAAAPNCLGRPFPL
ncbi:MAG: ABC transporter permease [Gammaproteobacteria bacterium]